MKTKQKLIKNKAFNWIINFLFIIGLLTLLVFFPNIRAIAETPSTDTAIQYHTFLPLTSRGGHTIYVSVTGDDANDGTLQRPLRTIEKASSLLEPGMILYIRGGIYNEAVKFYSSGTVNAQISILAYPGEIPILDGNNFTLPNHAGGALIDIAGNYVYISGLELRYSSYLGLSISGAHVTANKINAHHNLHGGINISGDYSVIENSSVWSNDMQNYNGVNPAGDSTGLTAARHPNYAIIRNNAVYMNWGIGLSTYESNGTIIEGNIVYDNFGPNIYISDTTNVLLQRNFVYSTGGMVGGTPVGIQLGDETSNPPSANISVINNIVYNTERNLACWKGSTGRMTNVLISNNTFVNSVYESNVIFNDGLLFDNVEFINNLVIQDGQLPVILVHGDHPGLTFSHNLWSKTPDSAASSPEDIIGDPNFAKVGDPYSPGYFMLVDVSPAIDAAQFISSVAVDYFGVDRLPPLDIGASEYFFDQK